MGQFGIGQPVTRFEDRRLLRGEGRFQNDVNLPGQTHAVIVRSVHAHADIRSIDTVAARRALFSPTAQANSRSIGYTKPACLRLPAAKTAHAGGAEPRLKPHHFAGC